MRSTGLPPCRTDLPTNSRIPVVFADGSVLTLDYTIDLKAFNALGTRNGLSYGELYNGVTSAGGVN